MKSILQNKEIKKHIKKAKKLGWCNQCMYPWNDGLCECEHIAKSYEYTEEIDRILVLSYKLEKEGYDFNITGE